MSKAPNASRISSHILLVSLTSLVVIVTGCATPVPRPSTPATTAIPVTTPPLVKAAPVPKFESANFNELPSWNAQFEGEQWKSLAQAITAQCIPRLITRLPEGWRALCSQWPKVDELLKLSPQFAASELKKWIENNFKPFRWSKGDTETTNPSDNYAGFMTGYYEASLRGSRTKSDVFQTPLYRAPPDMLRLDLESVYPETKGQRMRGRLLANNGVTRVVPYFSRAEITAKNLLANQELVWIDDPVDAFFLEIQGSGRVSLNDGSVMQVGYADQNGHRYVAIGRTLVDQGQLKREEVSMQSIRAWLKANPQQATSVLNSNPSYVFFRELNKAELGPQGSLDTSITAERSIAIDPKFMPLGSMVMVSASHQGKTIDRLTLAQDTGGAIRGPLRADYFWGFGANAEDQAGLMKARTLFWVLVPN